MGAELRPVEIGSIESELQRIWREQAGDAHKNDALLAVRTLNLIIYSPECAREDIGSMLDPIVVEHPARVIAIRPASGDEPHAWISVARMRSAGPRNAIGRELISIAAAPEGHRQLRSVIVPLLVHDLPVYLWWRGRPGFGDKLFDDLARAAGRVIIDSDALEDALRDLPAVAQAVPGNAVAFSDLAWARLTPWRQLAAQFFSAPPTGSYLRRLNHIVIEYGGGLQTRAVLLAAWLASRLGWQPVRFEREPLALVCRGDQDIRIEFHQVDAPAGLRTLRLSAADATFTVMRWRETGCFTTASEGAVGALRRRVPQHSESETEMISRELDLPGRDRLYEEALAMARALLER